MSTPHTSPAPVDPAVDPAAVRAVVFDLGNVLVELDNTRYDNGWPGDIGADHEGFEAWIAGEDLWYAYETGADLPEVAEWVWSGAGADVQAKLSGALATDGDNE